MPNPVMIMITKVVVMTKSTLMVMVRMTMTMISSNETSKNEICPLNSYEQLLPSIGRQSNYHPSCLLIRQFPENPFFEQGKFTMRNFQF